MKKRVLRGEDGVDQVFESRREVRSSALLADGPNTSDSSPARVHRCDGALGSSRIEVMIAVEREDDGARRRRCRRPRTLDEQPTPDARFRYWPGWKVSYPRARNRSDELATNAPASTLWPVTR
jgi:hypothetical protein